MNLSGNLDIVQIMSDSKFPEKVLFRNPVKVAMDARYGRTQTSHRHRNDRRAKDAKKSWKREEW